MNKKNEKVEKKIETKEVKKIDSKKVSSFKKKTYPRLWANEKNANHEH